mgnify:CR=1 FL=1
MSTNLGELRKAADKSAERMAAECGISKPTWCKAEAGQIPMRLEWLRVVARELACDPAEVLLSLGHEPAWVAETLGRQLRSIEALAARLEERLAEAAGKDA